MKQELIDSIASMEASGNVLKLPAQQLGNYAEVKQTLIKAGGKYCRGGYFQFDGSAKEVQNRLCGGEILDEKKEYQFFQTPRNVAIEMIKQAELEPQHIVLEPSAGLGAIAGYVTCRLDPKIGGQVYVCELNKKRAQILQELGYELLANDFLTLTCSGDFDRIIANPPFNNGQDIDHIRHMWELLAPGGRIVTICSPSWEFREQKKYAEFKDWINEREAVIYDLPAGTFKESGTNVRAVMIIIDKDPVVDRPRRPLSLSSES